jgi:hypothetical protein
MESDIIKQTIIRDEHNRYKNPFFNALNDLSATQLRDRRMNFMSFIGDEDHNLRISFEEIKEEQI